jgi:DNA polymerase III sliding clamp (beta) subunit (PCNA family)
LSRALSLLSRITERRQTLPALQCVRVKPTGGLVQLTAIDLEVGACLWVIDAEPEPTVPFLSNLANLVSIVKAQPKSVKKIALTLEVAPAKVTINGVKVEVLSAEDFPPVLPAKGMPVPVPGLMKALQTVATAISHDENRDAPNGV